MNRYWGRNEHGGSPRFSRDDEQLLALNYENLCDGDYLNRLFGTDTFSTATEDGNATEEQRRGAGPGDAAVLSPELAEDIIIYGNDLKLGRSFCHSRSSRLLASSLRQNDSVTNLFNRQAIVFEHIGKLMIDRCISAPAPVATLEKPASQLFRTNSVADVAGTALDCCLRLLDASTVHNLNTGSLLPLVSMVFYQSQESNIRLKHPSATVDGVGLQTLSAEHTSMLRNIFARSAMRCQEATFADQTHAATTDAFRSSMASFYGMLALGLYTGDASEVLVAVSQLMLILVRAEEWYAWYKAESKAQLTAALASAATQPTTNTSTAVPVTSDKSQATQLPTASATKLSLKGKVVAEGVKGRAANKVSNPVQATAASGAPVMGPTANGKEVVQAVGGLPSVASANSIATALSSTPVPAASSQSVQRADFQKDQQHSHLEEARTESAMVGSPIPPTGPIGLHPTHNSSNPNMKGWDASSSTAAINNAANSVNSNNKASASKLPAEKDRLGGGEASMAGARKPVKNIKAEARVIQEILDPNNYTAQELAAYYANNPSTVNYVMKGSSSNNQGGEEGVSGLSGKGLPKKGLPNGVAGNGNRNNNQLKTGEDAGSQRHSNPTAAVARHKKAMLEFKDMLQGLLKVPKPVLKVLHDACATVAATGAEQRVPSTTAAATTSKASSEAPSPAASVSTYVWSCGQNSYGELGLGDSVMRKTLTRVSCLDDKRILSIGAGNEHSLFVTQEGRLLTAGYNDNGQCGVGTTQQVRQPTVVTALEDEIAQVHVYNGCEHTLAVTRDGKIYSFGYNYRGQLGLGSTLSEQIPRPIRGLLSRRVVLAACSYHHSVMLCADGALFSCGRNDSGQLGHGDLIDKKTPQSVLNCPRGVTTVSCGQFHTVLATAAGTVHASGKNDYGQIGLEGTAVSKVFTELSAHPEVEQVVQVCCGYYHTLLLSATGVVAGFGRNDYGQLGLGHAQPKIFSCTVAASLRDKGVRSVSAGCYHSVVTTSNGMLYVFGRNNHGQLATGDVEERHTPHPVDDFVGQRVIAVAAGFYHTLVLTASSTTSDSAAKLQSPSKLATASLPAQALDLVEPFVTAASLGMDDGSSVLHPMMNDARLAAASALLLKDATQLTGIKTASTNAAPFIVPFSLERLSRVPARDMLLFLTSHFDSLVGAYGGHGVLSKKPLVSATGHQSPTPSPAWIASVLCNTVAMMEMCCGILNDTSGIRALPLNVEDALHLLLRVIRTCGALLREYHPVLLSCVSAATTVLTAEKDQESGLGYLTELLSHHDSKKQPIAPVTQPTQVTTADALVTFRECLRGGNDQQSGDGCCSETQAFRAVMQLRRKLLEMYFTLSPKELPLNSKYHTVATEIALIFGQSHRVLLPGPAVVAEFLSVLRDYTMPQVATNGISAVLQSLCVRMLTIFSATYRNSEEVIRSFQESKLDSIAVFRTMLALYGHFSMHGLVKRMHSSRLASGLSSSAHSAAQADIRRLVTVLEHGLSNFIKCGIPIVFAAGTPAARTAIGGQAERNAQIFQSGVELVREVLADATQVVDYVLAQQQSEEMLGQLRYGTIMPSILPSILIYGIAFAKHRGVMFDVVPDVSRLIHKLQLIGRPEAARAAPAPLTPGDKSGPGLSASPPQETGLGSSLRAAVGHLSHSLSSRLDGNSPSKDGQGGEGHADTADGFAEEAYGGKRDAQQISWWHRLVRLSTTFVAKTAAALIHSAPEMAPLPALLAANDSGSTAATSDVTTSEQSYSSLFARITQHPVWKFTFPSNLCQMDQPARATSIEAALALSVDEARAPEYIIALSAQHRAAERATDHVYRMLSQSMHSMFSTNVLNLIEEVLLDAVVAVCGRSMLTSKLAAPAFKLISRFTKHIHSHRSELMSGAGETSWVELLISLYNVVRLSCRVVVEGTLRVDHAVPLPLPAVQRPAQSTPARLRWRRAMMVVVCVARWKAAVRLHMKHMASSVVDFVTSTADAITEGFTVLPAGPALVTRIEAVLHGLRTAQAEAVDYDRGISMVLALLSELASNALRCDVLSVVASAMRESAEHLRTARAQRCSSSDMVMSTDRTCALQVNTRAAAALVGSLVRSVGQLRSSSALYSQQELLLLSSAVRLLQLVTYESSLNPQSILPDPLLPLSVVKGVLMQLRERQNSMANAASAFGADDKAMKKSSTSARERAAAYRRTAQDLLNLLQATVSVECASASASRPHVCAQLLDLHTFLITTFQQQRIEAMKVDAVNEEAARLSLEGKDTSQLSASHVGLLIGTSSGLSGKQQNKDGNRRRCQDLITKPMELCRTVEGFVVQGEKLLNNFKGVDFSLCFWMLVAKKSVAKQSFITGRLSHSEAWPVVFLRSDGKVEVVFGHANELEKIVSNAVVAHCTWTHLAVVVEQKKVKLFINGVQDCSACPSKSNTKAVLFPLVVGTCPSNVRTKVNHVKEGLDGMLAQYKYYSRALSPIHVKIVHDNGPPETSDVSAKLIYQMLSSLKCLLPPLHAPYVATSLREAAGIMHMLFVTDTSRRTRFAALDLLVEILLKSEVEDFSLWSNWSCPSSTAEDPQSVSVLYSTFISTRYTTLRERVVVYLLRLAGACWAPHLLASLESPLGAVEGVAASIAHLMSSAQGKSPQHAARAEESKQMHDFLRFAPCLALSSDVHGANPYALNATTSGVSVVDKQAVRREARLEICNHVVRALTRLATAPEWSAALSGVISGTLDATRAHTETLTVAPLPLRFDAMGVVVLLGGGTSGPYIGGEARNFFGDAAGRILNVNKTTNFATLLCWNALYGHQQIVKVRLTDLIVTPRQDMLPLSALTDEAAKEAVLNYLDALTPYVPLLLSDYMAPQRPMLDSVLQRTILKGLRPLEVFHFAQLLHAVLAAASVDTTSLVKDLATRPLLMNLLQQATLAAVEAQPSSAVHHLGDNRTSFTPPSVASMWLSCANYLFGVPDRVVARPLLGIEEVKALCEFVARNFSMPAESILMAPHAKLLKQGRMAELVQLLALNDGALGTVSRSDYVAMLRVAEVLHEDGATAEQPGVSGVYLVSDWSPTFAVDWPAVTNDSHRNEAYCSSMLTLLLHLRSELITNARRLMAQCPATSSGPVRWLKDASVWQALLPPSPVGDRFPLDTLADLLQARSATSWRITCEALYKEHRTEVTLAIAAGLRYFGVTLLQTNPLLMKSTDNLFETLDLFKRLLRAALRWVEHADSRERGEEVSVILLKVLLPHLSLIENRSVELQLMQLCMHVVRKLAALSFGSYVPSKELLEIVRSSTFTMLRTRAQEQVIKFKTHNMGSISALAYNLTQLVAGMEVIQRQAATANSVGVCVNAGAAADPRAAGHVLTTPPGSAAKSSLNSAHKVAQNQHAARIHSAETAAPKLCSVRRTAVDCDLTPCAESVLNLNLTQDEAGSTQTVDDSVVVEVAIGVDSPGGECHFETVYCGSSHRLVQSNLVPDCLYLIKCRAYAGATPLAWSPVVKFRTQKGVLFTFDPMKCGPDIRVSDDGLTASYGNDDTWSTVLGNRAFTSGVTHWNIRINASSTAYMFVGAATSAADLSSFLGGCAHGWGFIGEQALYHNREKVKVYGESFNSGDIVGVTLDLNQGTISFSRNGKPMGVAFEKVYGELYPAVAFYNVGQELEILTDGCITSCVFESVPISPSHLNMDDISLLSEMVLSLYRKHPLSHRLLTLVAEQCNQWCLAGHVRCRAVSGREVYLATESALLKRFGLAVGEKVRTPFGVAEVAGSAFNKVWFAMNAAKEVWYFNVQQILDGRTKKLFLRSSYDSLGDDAQVGQGEVDTGDTETVHQVHYDAATIQDLLDPSKWSEEMDQLLQSFLCAQADSAGLDNAWKVTSQQVADNFRVLQQQFSRIMVDNHELSHRWGITGPKRKAVLARIGLLRLLNQMLDMYLPFLVADSSSRAFVQNQPTVTDEFAPHVVSLIGEDATATNDEVKTVRNGALKLWHPPSNDCNAWPLVSLSWDDAIHQHSVAAQELLVGPIHAIRRLIFYPMKKEHFWEVVRRSTTRPAKTEDDYDYPDDLPHVKINRLKSFRAREASELLLIPGEDLMLSSMFCQLWRELRQHNDEKLRISYTHPMDDGQSRTFKIKFEGEGVDDYGGPYREIFQQICEELQSTDPSAQGGTQGRPSSWMSGEDKQSGEGGYASASNAIAAQAAKSKAPSGKPKDDNGASSTTPTRCFLPLLMPTPNWTADTDCTERYRYMFHPAAESPLKMDLFHFLGQLVGIAVRSRITLDLALPSYIWKYVVCERLTEQDIASFDAPAYATLQRLGAVHKQLAEMEATQSRGESVDASGLAMVQYNALELIEDLTWSYTRSDGVVVELIEGRGKQRVELGDVGRYLVLYSEARLSEGRHAIGMFRRGLVSILPESSLSLLNWEELQAMVCGPRTIDVQRLRDNTEYDDDLSPEDEHIVMFWEVLQSFSEAEKSAFLRFVWARPTLPPRGVEFTQKMRVLSAVGEDAGLKPDQYLPKAHTCFFSINLPKYSSKEVMAEKLQYAIYNCTEMDADFRTTEAEVAGWGAAAPTAGSADWQAPGAGDYN